MSSRARRHLLVSEKKSRRIVLWWALLLLLLNAAVIAYHGDPRALFGRAANAAHLDKPRPPAPSDARRAPLPKRSVVGAMWQHLLPVAHAEEPPAAAPLPTFAPAAAPPPDVLPPATAGQPESAPEAPEAKRFVGPPPPIDPVAQLRTPGAVQRAERIVLGDGRTAARALAAAGVTDGDVTGLLRALGSSLNLRRMRPQDVFHLRFDATNRVVSGSLDRGPLEQIVLRRSASGFVAERQRIAVDTVLQEVTGEVRSSLWEALMAAGEDPRLAQQLVDIFAYEVDFYSEVRAGDKFRLLVEKRFAHGQFLGYGDMLAAELVCGHDEHRAFLSKQSGEPEYYDETGAAMRKQLMRMPLQYGAVTSRFGRRRHPILGYTRAHNGVDYGVPIGTPVWSVGDGRVIRAGWHGGYGRLVEVLHANGWVSQYAHLSRIAVKKGALVRQRQTVGLVGMTGMATGPHLHYGLKHNGRYVNSLAQRFERASSLQGDALQVFAQEVARLMGEMDKMQVAHEPSVSPSGVQESS